MEQLASALAGSPVDAREVDAWSEMGQLPLVRAVGIWPQPLAAVFPHLALGGVRSGALMVTCGVAWLAGSLWGALVFVHRGPLVQLVLAYQRLRPGSRVAATVIGVAYVCAVAAPLARSSAVTVALVVAMMAAALVRQRAAAGAGRERPRWRRRR